MGGEHARPLPAAHAPPGPAHMCAGQPSSPSVALSPTATVQPAMDERSADAESDREDAGQTRGWMRSPLGRVLAEPLVDLVATAVARLEPHVADVKLAVRPLRRARARLPMRPVDR